MLKNIRRVLFVFLLIFFVDGCKTQIQTRHTQDVNNSQLLPSIKKKYIPKKVEIPTLVVIMNWDNYSENDPKIWHDKIFDTAQNSVNRWYRDNTFGEIAFVPIQESQGTPNDGVVTVAMHKAHPGGGNDYTFRDTEIKNAITNAAVVDNVDFTQYDRNHDGFLSAKELQFIFIVAGGEESYGDPQDHSIWAHSWSFASNSSLEVDGLYVMKHTADANTSGTYARFGANHGRHKATIGIMCHELGHAAFNLKDYYDDGGGSGLGWYDIMSGGSWAFTPSDEYAGETPTQYTAFNKIDAKLDVNVSVVNNDSATYTIGCSGRDFIKLKTTKENEFFLIECRDSAKPDSDKSFSSLDFSDNRLFSVVYHVDTDRENNNEDGVQTQGNHYMVALVEKDKSSLMTSSEDIRADVSDVYSVGDTIENVKMYDGSDTGYKIEITNADYTNREMTIRVSQ